MHLINKSNCYKHEGGQPMTNIYNRERNNLINYFLGKDVLIFNQQNCNDGHVNFRLKLPANIVTPRKSCFAFSYRFTSTGCAIRIHQVWNGKKKGHWFKKYFFDQPQNDWNTAKVTLDYTTYGVEHQVVITLYHWHFFCYKLKENFIYYQIYIAMDRLV